MPGDELPVTKDAQPEPVGSSAALTNTTAPLTEVLAEATPGLDLRSYELMERLGGGGMGDVYCASDPSLGRDLAVKVMKTELQGYAAAELRFIREARVTGSLQHPGIVSIHNLGRLADGRLHYTMRLVRGQTFAALLQEQAGRRDCLPALLIIFEKVCQAVAYAHSKRVIHRDLKPANVMVGRFGEVQVMDWGLAKLLTPGAQSCISAPSEPDQRGTRIHTEAGETPSEQTRMGREMGTPAYMPPEQALGEWDTVDERADVFALGAILCEILTGQPPYSGNEIEPALRQAKRGDCAEALTRLGSCGADAALVELCRECLAPTRERRPRDGDQVAQRVAAYQAEVQERLRLAELERAAAVVQARWERKRRSWILAAASLLLAGVAVSAWLAVRATTAEERALTAADAERQAKDLAQMRMRQIEEAAYAERQAKDLAQMRLKKIEKAKEILISIFRDLDPRAEAKGGPSLQLQLSRHLERAAAELDTGSAGDPVDAARLQNALGYSLISLGKSALAIELLSKAGNTLESELGPDHRETLAARSNLAVAYEYAGRAAEAIRWHEQTLKQMVAKLGANHPNTLTSRNGLAMAYLHAGRIAEAIRLHEQTLKQREAKLGTDHPETLNSRNNLAVAYQTAGRLAEAIPLYEQTLKKREAKFGIDHPDTLTSRNNLADAYQSAHRAAEAIPLFEQTLKQCEAKLGTDHPDTLNTRNNLAAAYYKAGRNAEALRLFEPTVKQMESKLGPDHPMTLSARSNLANVYRSVGRTDEAIRLLEQTLKQKESKLGPDHPSTLHALASLGVFNRDAGRLKDAITLLETALQRGRRRADGLPANIAWAPGALAETYEQDGQFAKAEPFFRDSLEQSQRQFGSDDPRTAVTLVQLGVNLLKQKKFRDAEPQLRQSLSIREKKQPDAWNTFNTRSALGEALSGQKRYTEAESLLLQGYEGVKKRQDKIPTAVRQVRLSEALERLVRLYESSDQKAKADEWRKKREEAKAVKKKTKS